MNNINTKKMSFKNIMVLVVFIVATITATSQNNTEGVSISSSVTPPDPSAMLDVQSSEKGVLIPRVALTGATDVTTVPSPATSLMVYNTSSTSLPVGFYYWNGAKWVPLGSNDPITIKHKVVDMGPFDLALPGSFGVAHGLPDHTKILDYKILINHDINSDIYCISYMGWNGDGTIQGSITTINATNVGFSLRSNSIFKNGNFSSLSISRGKVFITYYE